MQLKNLKTNYLGRNTIYYNKIDSTQKEIWRLIENNNSPSGTLIFADLQTKGIGTHGRTWYTDEAKNIAFSFFIKMNCDIEKLDGITIQIAKIIQQILKEKYEIHIEIKKPNDIVINNKKIGGILTQTKIVSEKVKYLVVGIGLNTEKEKFTKDIKDIATSIKKEFGKTVDTKEFIAEFCNEFEKEIIKRMEK